MKYYSTHSNKESAKAFIQQIFSFVTFTVKKYEIRHIEKTVGSKEEWELWIEFGNKKGEGK